MNNQNALIKELNIKLEQYMEEGNYEKVDEVSRQLCRLQSLEPVEEMPDDFILRLKNKEKSAMKRNEEKTSIPHYKKISRRAAGIAAAAAVFLLLGGTVSAAVLYNSGINIFEHGLSTSGEVTIPGPEYESPYQDVNLPDIPDSTTLVSEVSEEPGSVDNVWVEKKVYDENYTVYDSDDAVNWTPHLQTNHVTEYRYEDYYTAALDAGFEQLFSENYNGETLYYISEHTDEHSEGAPTDLSISGTYDYGNGSFTLSQYPGNTENTEFAVITNKTKNNREYVSSTGCLFALTDDQDENGQTRTHTLVKCDNYFLTLEFTGMSEEEIHAVLETVRLNGNF